MTQLDVLKIALAIIAGIGGVVALTVAYRRQREIEHSRFGERLAAAAAQLGSNSAAVRIAGVYAMAALADQQTRSRERRQQCIDSLCAYLRLPYHSSPEDGLLSEVTTRHTVMTTPGVQREEQRTYVSQPQEREVRLTIIRAISDHLQRKAITSWQRHDFNFTGATLDGGDFRNARFTGGDVSFAGAEFTGGDVSFAGAEFTREGYVNFTDARFAKSVSFQDARFAGIVNFSRAKFTGRGIRFSYATFTGDVFFTGARFAGIVSFNTADFTGGNTSFGGAEFTGGEVGFSEATFTDGNIDFRFARFAGGYISFSRAKFTRENVDFSRAKFTGGNVDLREPGR